MNKIIFLFLLFLCSNFVFGQGTFPITFVNVTDKPINIKIWDEGKKLIGDYVFESGQGRVFELKSFTWFYFERKDTQGSVTSPKYAEHIAAAGLLPKEENENYKVVKKEKDLLVFLLFTNESHFIQMIN